MDAYSAVIGRRSIRKYRKEVPSRDLIEKVVFAGRSAASGMNTQAWHFTVITDPGVMKEVNEYITGSDNSICYGAPVFIMVSYDKSSRFAIEDTSSALTNMMIAAYSLGLGSVWINIINRNEEKASNMTRFSVPEGYRVYGCLALGYPEDIPLEKRALKSEAETVTYL